MADWTIESSILQVYDKLNNISLPLKPQSFGSDYVYPEDISSITSIDLGKWLFRLASWRGYIGRLITKIKIEESIISEGIDAAIARKMSELETVGKKSTKDAALGACLLDDTFRKFKMRLIDVRGEIIGLETIADIYNIQYEAISREISRRTLDLKNLGV